MRAPINAVCEQYAKARRAEEPPVPAVRGRRSLGWGAAQQCRDLKREGEAFRSCRILRVFHSRALAGRQDQGRTNFSCDGARNGS